MKLKVASFNICHCEDCINKKIDFEKILSVDVPEKILSDHLPITARIEV